MKKIIIDTAAWQTRIALTRDGVLQNVYFSSPTAEQLERVYFKGKVIKVLPGIQTAFVDIGQEKAGFLHISEIDHELALEKMSKTTEIGQEGSKKARRPKLDIANILREGDPILVQVSKEPVYEKGAKLTTCFTLPGRFLVLMPNIAKVGVSKKIEQREERTRLKDIVSAHLPEGMGAIIRTSAQEQTEKEILKDIRLLVGQWEAINESFKTAEVAQKVHEDLPLSLQIVRDHLDDEVEAVITDSRESQQQICKFVKKMAPEFVDRVLYYNNEINIFDFYAIQDQLLEALKKKASLASGGSLIIETTEAMTVIDVNTGKFIGKSNMEETILKTNLEAAEEVVRQLRLRNIGGLIVIDFIDMAKVANRHKLNRFFEKMLKERDRFQSVVLKVSDFGIIQMTRKRSGKTLQQQLTNDCENCHGLGHVMSLRTQCFALLRELGQRMRELDSDTQYTLLVNPDMFTFLMKDQYNAILALEKMCGSKLVMESSKTLGVQDFEVKKVA